MVAAGCRGASHPCTRSGTARPLSVPRNWRARLRRSRAADGHTAATRGTGTTVRFAGHTHCPRYPGLPVISHLHEVSVNAGCDSGLPPFFSPFAARENPVRSMRHLHHPTTRANLLRTKSVWPTSADFADETAAENEGGGAQGRWALARLHRWQNQAVFGTRRSLSQSQIPTP